MDQGKRKLATTLLAAASLTASAASLQAVNYAEPGDAGQTLATAANTGLIGNTTLTSITGTIGTSTDADLFIFTLSATSALRFTASSTAGVDTSLFLFDSTGRALLANDDVSGTNFQATITTGGLPAGTYYLGISLSGNEPINSVNQLLFTPDSPTTSPRGPAAGINPTTEGTFNGGTFFAETGAYTVAFAVVPEPSSVVTALLGAGATFAFVRRLRRQPTA